LIREQKGMVERLREREKMLNEKIEHAERERKEILRKAYEEARLLAIETKRRLNSIMEEGKVKGHRLAKKEIEAVSKEVKERIRDLSGEPIMDISSIKEGDMVFVRSIGEDLKVTKVMGEKGVVKVRLRNMEIEVPLEDLSPSEGFRLEGRGSVFLEMEERAERELNIIGLRVDEGLSRLDSFLNHAFLSGLREVRVIHGVGKGLLLRAVREYLKGHELIEDFYPAEAGHGGNGVTIIRLASKV
ncbi:MAG: Smr/MutS family protein, partial [Thermodesulfovibrionales bacterium]